MQSYALPAEVYGAGLVFCRIGALVMLMPAVGEQAVSPRIRLAFALLLSLTFFPILRSGLPMLPDTVGGMGAHVLLEVVVGLALGALLRLFMGALAVAGEVVSIQTTLSFAQTANPMEAVPSATLATFLNLLGLALIFGTGLHQLFIGAMVKSYTLFPAGRGLPVSDFVQLEIKTFGQMFALGIQLSAPVMVFGLVFNIATGFVGRIMPQFQIFFVASPLSVLFGLSIFGFSLGVLGLVWIDGFRAVLRPFL